MECTTCFKLNKDESLNIAIDEAKKIAIQNSYPVAIVQENGEYRFYNAFFAYQNSMQVIRVISNL
jgi:hypothetical protein